MPAPGGLAHPVSGLPGWPPAVSRARHFVPVDNNRAAQVSEGTMRQSFSSGRPETAAEPPLGPRGPAVERIAGWSATHRKTAVIGWLHLVAAVFVGGAWSRPRTCRRTTPASPGGPSRF